MATLVDVFASLFPDAPNRRAPFRSAPILPADVFAFVGHVLERSGAYHHIAPEVTSQADGDYRRIVVDDDMRLRAVRLGHAWRETPPPSGRRLPPAPAEVEALWAELSDCADSNVFAALEDTAEAPDWWLTCLELLMIADEASQGIGFAANNPFSAPTADAYLAADLSSGDVFRRVQHGPFSLSSATEDLVCVQPKSRTPSLGCTLRSLTHNLALLPPRGQVRARWVEPPFGPGSKSGDRDLGLLVVPFPYRVADDAFRSAGDDPSGRWGWFDAEQTWLPKNTDDRRRTAFVDFVLDLIAQARAKGQRVDGVVLPELALNYRQFRALGAALAKDGQIDFLISGLSRNPRQRPGNFVGIAPFFLLGDDRSQDITGWEKLVLVREKHHRWKLEKTQIQAYGLGLDPGKSWWENLTILSRSIDVMVYRGGTTLTTLICEDLARVDPCQAVVRAIGPNLLIALLMDGPQIGARWPGRYATVLAEDPGTSVLTFTSFGLIARQNDVGAFGQASSIALWKDEATGVKNLELPREADALVLQLRSHAKTEHTLDGRSDGGTSHRWEYESHTAVAALVRPDWIKSGVGKT